MNNIYNAIQNLYNMDKTTWQEVLAELYNVVANVENKFDLFEIKFGSLLGEQVTRELKKMYDDGSLASLINDMLLKDINKKVDTFKIEVNEQLDTKASKDDVAKISSGTPLFASGTTEMADTTRNYVNTTDGYLYIYSNGNWTKTNVKYQSTGLDDDLNNRVLNSVQAIMFENVLTNSKPSAGTYYNYTLSTGQYSSNDGCIDFTPTSVNGQVQYNGFSAKNFKTYNKKIYIEFKIKCEIGTRDGVNLMIRHSSNTTFLKQLSTLTTTYQTIKIVTDRLSYDDITNNNNGIIVIYDTNSSNFVKISIKEFIVVDLTAIFGVGNEPSLDYINNLGINYFETVFNTNISEKSLYNLYVTDKPLFINLDNEIININSKYNSSKDVMFKMGKKGVNNIFDFINATLKYNETNKVLSDSNLGSETLWSNGTDAFAPHCISVKNNADGDRQTLTDFTGGNHGYDNSGIISQTSTGRTTKIIFKVDGRIVQKFNDYANYVEIIWTNRIQANNTKKIDGSGREVLEETYSAKFDGFKWDIDYISKILEDVTYHNFYGLQFVSNLYPDGVYYHTSTNRKNNVNKNTASTSGSKKTTRFTVKNDTTLNFVDVEIDVNHGIGTREFLNSPNGAFSTSINKSYMFLISENDFYEGDILSFKGSYKFYSKN